MSGVLMMMLAGVAALVSTIEGRSPFFTYNFHFVRRCSEYCPGNLLEIRRALSKPDGGRLSQQCFWCSLFVCDDGKMRHNPICPREQERLKLSANIPCFQSENLKSPECRKVAAAYCPGNKERAQMPICRVQAGVGSGDTHETQHGAEAAVRPRSADEEHLRSLLEAHSRSAAAAGSAPAAEEDGSAAAVRSRSANEEHLRSLLEAHSRSAAAAEPAPATEEVSRVAATKEESRAEPGARSPSAIEAASGAVLGARPRSAAEAESRVASGERPESAVDAASPSAAETAPAAVPEAVSGDALAGSAAAAEVGSGGVIAPEFGAEAGAQSRRAAGAKSGAAAGAEPGAEPDADAVSGAVPVSEPAVAAEADSGSAPAAFLSGLSGALDDEPVAADELDSGAVDEVRSSQEAEAISKAGKEAESGAAAAAGPKAATESKAGSQVAQAAGDPVQEFNRFFHKTCRQYCDGDSRRDQFDRLFCDMCIGSTCFFIDQLKGGNPVCPTATETATLGASRACIYQHRIKTAVCLDGARKYCPVDPARAGMPLCKALAELEEANEQQRPAQTKIEKKIDAMGEFNQQFSKRCNEACEGGLAAIEKRGGSFSRLCGQCFLLVCAADLPNSPVCPTAAETRQFDSACIDSGHLHSSACRKAAQAYCPVHPARAGMPLCKIVGLASVVH